MMQRGLLRTFGLGLLVLLAVVAAGCGSDSGGEETAAEAAESPSGDEPTVDEPTADNDAEDSGQADSGEDAELFPDVVGATAELGADGTWTFSATLSSPYDTPERYADGWRVVGPDGTVYGERPLGHDHQSEQPFTRSQSGIEIPEDVTEVTVEGRDQLSGWGGATFQVTLER